MEKKDSLYNYGMRPACLASSTTAAAATATAAASSSSSSTTTATPSSPSAAATAAAEWCNTGTMDVCYYKNGKHVLKASSRSKTSSDAKSNFSNETVVVVEADGKRKKSKLHHLYSLVFTYTFTRPGECVYFAHAPPYTYTDLQNYLHRLQMDVRINSLLHRSNMCFSLAGNRCELVTVTARTSDHEKSRSKPCIVVSARVHPGETNSSFIMHGLIDFLVSDCKEAEALRQAYVFKIVPMLNPDGVIHGNYRCSLAGTDLNRRYGDCHHAYHPTIHAMKELLTNMSKKRGVAMYLDLHGHSKKKNAFLYGCDILQSSSSLSAAAAATGPSLDIENQRIFARTFPRVLCNSSKYFSFRDCCFSIDKSKSGTGRVVGWRDLGIPCVYTIEASFCGSGNNAEVKMLRKSSQQDCAVTRPQSKDCVGRGGGPKSVSPITFEMASDDEMQMASMVKTSSSSLDEASREAEAALTQLVMDYKTSRHYCKNDLLSMGKDICIGILLYANLKDIIVCSSQEQDATEEEMPKVKSPSTTSRGSSSSIVSSDIGESNTYNAFVPASSGDDEDPRNIFKAETTRRASRKKKKRGVASAAVALNQALLAAKEEALLDPENDDTGDERAQHCKGIETFTTASLRAPLLVPGVFSSQALVNILKTQSEIAGSPTPCMDHLDCLRLQSECEVRQLLSLEGELESILPAREEHQLKLLDEEDGGSDSDPSVDNCCLSDFRATVGKCGNAGLAVALRRATLKRRREENEASRRNSEAELRTNEIELLSSSAAATVETMVENKKPAARKIVSQKTSLPFRRRSLHQFVHTPQFKLDERPPPPRNGTLSFVNLNETTAQTVERFNAYVPALERRRKGVLHNGRRKSISSLQTEVVASLLSQTNTYADFFS